MNKKNRFLEFIEYILVKLIFGIFHLFPYEKGIRFGSKLFKILYIIPILRKIAYKNIEFIFHDYENFSKLYNINIPFKKFKKIIFLKNLENLGKIFFTLIYSPKINQKNISSLIKNNVDMALFNKLFEERKGLICLSFHFGNWELNGIFFSMMGYPINVIFRPLDNKLLDRYLQKYRSDKKVNLISKFSSPIKFIRPLFNGEILSILADQNTLKHGIFIPFFKRIASSNQGAAKFYILSKANMLIMYSYYKGNILYLENDIHLIPEKLYNELDIQEKAKLLIFNDYFNYNKKNVSITFFEDLINLDSYKIKEDLIPLKSEDKKNILNKFILENKDKLENFYLLTEEEKIFFINYFYHQILEKIIKKYPENWMLIHERWKKQPENFSNLYK